MIYREALNKLQIWKDSYNRHPLLLRGARQVGKSYLAKEFGKSFETFVEINFEEQPSLKKIFAGDLVPQKIISSLELALNRQIVAEKTLLFFDEIQSCPSAILALRYFYEKMPELHLIAAGSLLEFEIEKVGMPVGRVESIFIYPVTFHEFIKSIENREAERILESQLEKSEITEYEHHKMLELINIYCLIGGMPEASNAYVKTQNMLEVFKVQDRIIATYRQDFNRYAKTHLLDLINLVFDSVPQNIGKKIKYINISRDNRAAEVAKALRLLVKAGIIHQIFHSNSNGLPIAAEQDLSDFKIAFLDIGLMLRMLKVNLDSAPLENINNGAIAEQLVAQELLGYSESNTPASLFYWRAESKTGNAEVDFIIESNGQIKPIEVKAGAVGKLKSLKLFLNKKQHISKGYRIYSGRYDDDEIVSLPFYMLRRGIYNVSLNEDGR